MSDNRQPVNWLLKLGAGLVVAVLGVALLYQLGIIFQPPRPYQDLEKVLSSDLMGWEIAVEPDHRGPYRRPGGLGSLVSNPNGGVMGRFTTEWASRRINYPGQPGYSLKVVALETKDGHLTDVVLRCKNSP